MINHNFIDVLKTLHEKEMKRFLNFLKSPYFNTEERLTSVFTELVKYHGNYDNPLLTREYLLRNATGTKKYNASTFRVIMHKLLILLFEFFVIEDIRGTEINNKSVVLGRLFNARLYDIMKKELTKNNRNNRNEIIDYNLLHDKYIYESHVYNYYYENLNFTDKKAKNIITEQTNEADKYLFIYFITELIKSYINSVVLIQKFNISKNLLLSKKLIDCIDKKQIILIFKDDNIISTVLELYSLLYELFDKRINKTIYIKCKQLLKKLNDEMSINEISFHYRNLINLCVIKNNSQNSLFFTSELFNLYEYYIKYGLFKNDASDHIPPDLYRSIIINAIKYKKYEWFENFMNNFLWKLPPRHKDNLYNLCYAIYYINTDKFSDALELTEKITTDKTIYKYDKYMLKLMVFLNFEDPEKLLALMNTFKKFIRKDETFNEARKIPYKLFNQYISDITNYREDKKRYDINEIRDNIKNDNVVLYKNWLLKKIDIFDKKKKVRYYRG